MNITPASLVLFLELANDAGNWSGHPLFGGNVGDSPAARGNLTQLKQAGLVTTQEEEDSGRCMTTGRKLRPTVWVTFTPAGRALAAQHGVDVAQWYGGA